MHKHWILVGQHEEQQRHSQQKEQQRFLVQLDEHFRERAVELKSTMPRSNTTVTMIQMRDE